MGWEIEEIFVCLIELKYSFLGWLLATKLVLPPHIGMNKESGQQLSRKKNKTNKKINDLQKSMANELEVVSQSSQCEDGNGWPHHYFSQLWLWQYTTQKYQWHEEGQLPWKQFLA